MVHHVALRMASYVNKVTPYISCMVFHLLNVQEILKHPNSVNLKIIRFIISPNKNLKPSSKPCLIKTGQKDLAFLLLFTVGAVIVDLSRKHYNHPRRTWTDAVRECYKQYGYQISSDVNSVVQNNSALMTSERAWIGSFRKHYDFTTTTFSGP